VAAVWRALLIIDTNSFAISDDFRMGDAESWRLGRAVYPVASLINHSCRYLCCMFVFMCVCMYVCMYVYMYVCVRVAEPFTRCVAC
jgi:hypothetical protein